jgi:monoterpene epsilon-lactone hydrolase
VHLRLGVALRASAAAIAVTLSRIRRGRGLPRWTWAHEVVLTAMKREFVRLAPLTWASQRETWRAIALPAFAIGGARFERSQLAGRAAEWITPSDLPRDLQGHDAATLLYLHGGAYLFGTIEEYSDFASCIARAARARAVVVDYRLAPEHPFPAALEDAVAAYEALLASGLRADRIVVAGDSAGGGLTASLLVALRERGVPLPAGAVLVSPWVDLAASGGSLVTNEPHDFFTPELVEHWARTVLAGADPADPRASPARADLHGLPPLLVQVGGAEMILDQVVTFADRARTSGVDVRLRVWEDCFHDWPLFAAVLADGRGAVEQIGAFAREVLNGTPAPGAERTANASFARQ